MFILKTNFRFVYSSFASSIVSGNFFEYVSGLKTTRIAARIAEPANKNTGNEPYCAP